MSITTAIVVLALVELARSLVALVVRLLDASDR
jgi:hypothetical protein